MSFDQQAEKHATRASYVSLFIGWGSLLLFFALAGFDHPVIAAVVTIAGLGSAYFATPRLYAKLVRFPCPHCDCYALTMQNRFDGPTSYRCRQCGFVHETNVRRDPGKESGTSDLDVLDLVFFHDTDFDADFDFEFDFDLDFLDFD